MQMQRGAEVPYIPTWAGRNSISKNVQLHIRRFRRVRRADIATMGCSGGVDEGAHCASLRIRQPQTPPPSPGTSPLLTATHLHRAPGKPPTSHAKTAFRNPPSCEKKNAWTGREGGAAPARRMSDVVERGVVEQGQTRGPAPMKMQWSRQFGFKMASLNCFKKHARALEGLRSHVSVRAGSGASSLAWEVTGWTGRDEPPLKICHAAWVQRWRSDGPRPPSETSRTVFPLTRPRARKNWSRAPNT